jgi:hypothetical protein
MGGPPKVFKFGPPAHFGPWGAFSAILAKSLRRSRSRRDGVHRARVPGGVLGRVASDDPVDRRGDTDRRLTAGQPHFVSLIDDLLGVDEQSWEQSLGPTRRGSLRVRWGEV